VSVFRCPECGRLYGDPHYHGPAGHAPPQLCFDCWVHHWFVVETMMENERGPWQRVEVALFLLCQGFSCEQAARGLGVHYKTIYYWLRRLRRNPERIPDWLIRRARSAPRSTFTEAGR